MEMDIWSIRKVLYAFAGTCCNDPHKEQTRLEKRDLHLMFGSNMTMAP